MNDWKQEISANFQQWLEQLEQSPSQTAMPDNTGRPDLYSFFEELCILRNDVSKSAKRSHETFARFVETLDRFDGALREVSQRLASNQQHGQMQPIDRKRFLAPYAQILERMDRLAEKLANPPQMGFFSHRRSWQTAWNTLDEGFKLLREHFRMLLHDSGIVPMETVGQAFDPARMKAVAVENSDTATHNTVIEELATGYTLNDDVLKFAEVKIAINKGEPL